MPDTDPSGSLAAKVMPIAMIATVFAGSGNAISTSGEQERLQVEIDNNRALIAEEIGSLESLVVMLRQERDARFSLVIGEASDEERRMTAMIAAVNAASGNRSRRVRDEMNARIDDLFDHILRLNREVAECPNP